MNSENFFLAVKAIDEQFSKEFIYRMFNEGISLQDNEEYLQENAFIYLLLHYGAGDMRDFRNFLHRSS